MAERRARRFPFELLLVVPISFAAALADALIGGWDGDDIITSVVVLASIVYTTVRYRRSWPLAHTGLALILQAPMILIGYFVGLAIEPASDTRNDELAVIVGILAILITLAGAAWIGGRGLVRIARRKHSADV